MSVICAVLVPYMSGQKGEFIHCVSRLCTIQLHACVPNSFSIRRKHFAGNLVHVLSLTMNIILL